MAKKHIKVEFPSSVAVLRRVDTEDHRFGFSPEECLELAVRAESLDHKEWADHWLQQGLVEEHILQQKMLGQLEIGV